VVAARGAVRVAHPLLNDGPLSVECGEKRVVIELMPSWTALLSTFADNRLA